MVERNPVTWDVAYTQASRGHCETISQIGMKLSFVGSRFSAEELTRPGCALFVTVSLPDGPVSAVASIVYCDRPGSKGRGKWLVGVTISQMSESDASRLAAYISKRARAEPFVAVQ